MQKLIKTQTQKRMHKKTYAKIQQRNNANMKINKHEKHTHTHTHTHICENM